MKNISIEWEKSDNILDSLAESKPVKLNLRVYSTKKQGMGLEKMVDKVIAIIGLSLAKPETYITQAFIGLLLILSINPFEFKVMRGNGLDTILDKLNDSSSSKDNLYIDKHVIDEIIASEKIDEKCLEWFLKNKLFELQENKYYFKGNNLKSAKIFQYS